MTKTISHEQNQTDFNKSYLERMQEIHKLGDNERSTVSERLAYLEKLSQFELGRFLIVNRGMNGFWTHYVCTAPQRSFQNLSELEMFLLYQRPMALATQERFQKFLMISQLKLRANTKIASIPSGLMGDLLFLDYSNVSDFELTAIDIDPESLMHAEQLAIERRLTLYFQKQQNDAWELNIKNNFDLICSSGLNIYVDDSANVIKLYQQFFDALKPGAHLITSFLNSRAEWVESMIDTIALKKQQIIYQDVLGFKGNALRSTKETLLQLESAGFCNIEFHYDRAKIFPTVVAQKSK